YDSPINDIRFSIGEKRDDRLFSAHNGSKAIRFPPSRAQSRKGCFSWPNHLCQVDSHSQERKGGAPDAPNIAFHSARNPVKASAPSSILIFISFIDVCY